MTKIKEFTVLLTEADKLDIRLIQDKNQITGFVINYRAKMA